jgi:hypothetical protein
MIIVLRMVAASLFTLVLLAASPADALAQCRCEGTIDIRERLAKGDAALVGTVTRRQFSTPGGGQPRFDYTMQVERAMNATLGPEVKIAGPPGDSPCEVVWDVGARVAAIIDQDEAGNWEAYPTQCDGVTVERLLAAARPPRPVSGRGRPSFLSWGRVGGARLIALSRRGRALAYGFGPGLVVDVSVCPGSRRLVELVRRDSDTVVTVRSLRTLAPIRTAGVKTPFGQVHCADPSGRDLFVALVDAVMRILPVEDDAASRRRRARVWLEHVRGFSTRLVMYPSGGSVAFSGSTAYVGAPNRIRAVELGARGATTVARAAEPTAFAISPDGRRLAFDTAGGPRLLDLRTRHLADARAAYGAPLTWLSPTRLLATANGRMTIFGNRLQVVRKTGAPPLTGEPLGDELFEARAGRLIATRVIDGRERIVATLPAPTVEGLVAVPDALPLRATRKVPRIAHASRRLCR